MERPAKPRHGREGGRLSEREVSESNPVARLSVNFSGSFDWAQDDPDFIGASLTTNQARRSNRLAQFLRSDRYDARRAIR
jgi:hypothetical protein